MRSTSVKHSIFFLVKSRQRPIRAFLTRVFLFRGVIPTIRDQFQPHLYDVNFGCSFFGIQNDCFSAVFLQSKNCHTFRLLKIIFQAGKPYHESSRTSDIFVLNRKYLAASRSKCLKSRCKDPTFITMLPFAFTDYRQKSLLRINNCFIIIHEQSIADEC